MSEGGGGFGVPVRRGAGGRGVDPRDVSAAAAPQPHSTSTSSRHERLASLWTALDLGFGEGATPAQIASLVEGAVDSDPELRSVMAAKYTDAVREAKVQAEEAKRLMPDMLRVAEFADQTLPETAAVVREVVRRSGGYPPGPPLNQSRRRTRSHITGAKHFPQWVRERLADRARRMTAPCTCPSDLLDEQHMAYPHHREGQGAVGLRGDLRRDGGERRATGRMPREDGKVAGRARVDVLRGGEGGGDEEMVEGMEEGDEEEAEEDEIDARAGGPSSYTVYRVQKRRPWRMRERWDREAREVARGLDAAVEAAGKKAEGIETTQAAFYDWEAGWIGNGRPLHLATHLWHARRFRMERRWGVMVATKANDFGTRAASRFARKTCVVHDASYLAPIEIFATGEERTAGFLYRALHDGVLRLPSTGKGGITMDGDEGGEIHGFLCDGERLVAPVIVSRGSSSPAVPGGDASNVDTASSSAIWVWVHAAAFRDAVSVLSRAAQKSVGVSARSLRGEVVRFSVRGPYAPKVLTTCLGGAASGAWTLTPGSIIEFDATDPRRVDPSEQTVPHIGRAKWSAHLRASRESAAKATPSNLRRGCGIMRESSRRMAEAAFASLKDSEVAEERARSSLTMMPLDTLRCERHRWQARFGERTPATYPVTIAAMRGSMRCKDGAISPGFDVVLPSAMGLHLWKNLVRTGAQAVGQDAVRQLSVEDGRPHFPDDFPGVMAHAAYVLEQIVAPRVAERSRLPPAKRIPEEDEGYVIAQALFTDAGDSKTLLAMGVASVDNYLNHGLAPAVGLGLRVRLGAVPKAPPSPLSWTPKQIEGLTIESSMWTPASLPSRSAIPVRVLLYHGGVVNMHAELFSPCVATIAYWRREVAAKNRKRGRTPDAMNTDLLGLPVARTTPPNPFPGAYGGIRIGVVTGATTSYDAGIPAGIASVLTSLLSGLSSHQRRLGVVQGPYVAAYVALRNPGESGRVRPVLATLEPIC